MRFVSPNNQPVFNLDIDQPIHLYCGDKMVAYLRNSLSDLIEQLNDLGNTPDEDWDQPKDIIENEDDSFGNPLDPADWVLLGNLNQVNEVNNRLVRLNIVQAFTAMHGLYISSLD